MEYCVCVCVCECVWVCACVCECLCGNTAYLVDLRVGTLVSGRLALVPGPAAVVTPATEMTLVLPAPTLGAVCTAHPTVVHLH